MRPFVAVTILLLASCVSQASSSGLFELRLKSFANELGRLADGSCCNGRAPPGSVCPSACRTRFRVCLKHYQANIDTTSPCTFGDVTTPVLGDNNVDMNGNDRASAGFVNPISIPFDFTWPGTFSLIVEAWQDSNDTSAVDSTLIARMTKQAWLGVGPQWREDSQRWLGRSLLLEYRVTCAPHYYGGGCASFCRPRDDNFGHYTCTPDGARVCLAGWTGDYCSKPRCLPGCDTEHGQCNKPDECVCHPGWVGRLCDECERYPGCMHGTCHKPWDCLCEEGWGGLFCNQDLNYCTNHKPCQNGGTCFNTGQGSYTCSCPAGFAGSDCDLRADDCREPTGACIAGECRGSSDNLLEPHRCECPPDRRGARCEFPVRTCADRPCQRGGTCAERAGGYACICPPGTSGADCEIDVDACVPSPCLNGGTCKSNDTEFTCSCPLGFEGKRCETNIDDCASNPCLNSATCVDQVASYRCQCVPGYIGQLCETRVDFCLAKPCANGGECSILDNDYRCMCRPGFAGKDCSIDVDECANAPCLNGGTCKDRVNGFTCSCSSGWTGRTCSTTLQDAAAAAAAAAAGTGETGGLSRAHSSEGAAEATAVVDAVNDEAEVASKRVLILAALSGCVPAAALLAAAALAAVKRRRRRRAARADAEARAQNERNAHSSRVIRNTWGKCANNDPAECQNAHNASMAEEGGGGGGGKALKQLNTDSAARLLAQRLSDAPDAARRLSALSADSLCNTSDSSLLKRPVDCGGGGKLGAASSVYVIDDHYMRPDPTTFATQV